MRLKAKIRVVGTVTPQPGGFIVSGFHLDACGKPIPLIEIDDGIVYFGGWSGRDLAEVALRPSEFVEID